MEGYTWEKRKRFVVLVQIKHLVYYAPWTKKIRFEHSMALSYCWAHRIRIPCFLRLSKPGHHLQHLQNDCQYFFWRSSDEVVNWGSSIDWLTVPFPRLTFFFKFWFTVTEKSFKSPNPRQRPFFHSSLKTSSQTRGPGSPLMDEQIIFIGQTIGAKKAQTKEGKSDYRCFI